MRIEVTEAVQAELLDPAWRLYNDAFDELRSSAVQRHLMYRDEFDEQMRDVRVQKYLSFSDNGKLDGLATFSNHLDAVPLISPEYFQQRWPIHFAEHRIWYVGFIAVHPSDRRSGTFQRLVETMYQKVAGKRAIVALDMCRRNAEFGLPRAIETVLTKISDGVRTQRVDEQSYWLYEFPAA
jgi:ribosomal protein S18 acetylase RimI-like enzyme